ncbi:MAG TPA: DedA family protein, partial [Oscillatoriaceae cyanobacterium]
ETIIIIATLMASQGVLNVEYLYPAVVLGAVVGGNLGYGVGALGGRPLLLRAANLWRIKEHQLESVEAQFARHGNWAVFFGRFVMLLRVFAGPIAGILRMPWPRFFLFNLLGAAAWAALIIVLTYIFGENIRVLLHHVSLTVLVLLVIFAVVLGVRQWRRNQA